MDDKTLNVPEWWPDEPIPIFNLPATFDTNKILFSSADWRKDQFTKWCKEYAAQLDNEINQSRYRELCETIPTYYVTLPDDIVDKFNSIGCTSFVLTADELERLLENKQKENNNE